MSLFSTLKNKHVVIAMFVAPLLAVAAWYVTGRLAGVEPEEPSPAQAGQAYPLLERSGCRYPGGNCVLSNEDFELAVSVSAEGVVVVKSSVPVDYLMVGLRSSGDAEPVLAQNIDDTRQQWTLRLSDMPAVSDALRFVSGVNGAAWFGEASLAFLEAANIPGQK